MCKCGGKKEIRKQNEPCCPYAVVVTTHKNSTGRKKRRKPQYQIKQQSKMSKVLEEQHQVEYYTLDTKIF